MAKKPKGLSAEALAGLEQQAAEAYGVPVELLRELGQTEKGRGALRGLATKKLSSKEAIRRFKAGEYKDTDEDFFKELREGDSSGSAMAGESGPPDLLIAKAEAEQKQRDLEEDKEHLREIKKLAEKHPEAAKFAEEQKSKVSKVSVPEAIPPDTLLSWELEGLEKKTQVAEGDAANSNPPASIDALIDAVIDAVGRAAARNSRFQTKLTQEHLAVGGRGQQKAEYAAKVLIYDDFLRKAGGNAGKWVDAPWAPLSPFTSALKSFREHDPRILIATGDMASKLHPESSAYEPSEQTAGALPPEVYVAKSEEGGWNKFGGHLHGARRTSARPWKPENDNWTAEAWDMILRCVYSDDEVADMYTKSAEEQ